jgi:hypothetical protein
MVRYLSRRRVAFQLLATTTASGLFAFGPVFPFSSPSAQADEKPISRDERNSDILSAVKSLLESNGIKGVTGIGPVSAEGDTCLVLLENKDATAIPDSVKGQLRDNSAFAVQLIAKDDLAYGQLFADASSSPVSQHSGPLMGGDPIWNDAVTQWGTISFAVSSTSSIKIENQPCANQSISCEHVLNQGSSLISTPNYPDAMTLTWSKRSPTASPWLDVAGATFSGSTPFTALTVRGLGAIQVARQPLDGIRVSKYGATSWLTSGKDLGLAWRAFDPQHPSQLYLIRRVSGYFSNEGDSGAAVLDADRNLVGMVIAGKLLNGQPVEDESYYMQVLPRGEVAPDPNLSVFVVEGL